MNRPPRTPRVLVVCTAGTFVLAVTGLVAPGSTGALAGRAALVLVVVVPLARVAALGVRWAQVGDRRYAAVAAGLLAVIAAGATLSLLM